MQENNALIRRFRTPPKDCGLYIYFEPGRPDATEDEIVHFMEECRVGGVACVIPHLCETTETDVTVLDAMRTTYALLLREGRRTGIHIAFNLEKVIENAVVQSAEKDGVNLHAKVLDRHLFYCDRSHDEEMSLHLQNPSAHRVAIVAVDRDRGETHDLRDCVHDDKLFWKTPEYGNWTIEEYFFEDDPSPNADYLDYDLCREYLRRAYDLFSPVFNKENGFPTVLHYADIGYHAENRRNWSRNFNEVFRETYGFDPAPYYPHAYQRLNDDSPNVKALMFCCRAALLQKGICRALFDFAEEHGLSLLSTLTEPKLSSPSPITGDAILDNSYSPGALLDRSYLYGVNSLKIAAAGADNFGRERVSCELYRDYCHISLSVIYKDAINALGRGANLVMAHTARFSAIDKHEASHLRDFSTFVARTQALLRGGSHVSDIAVLYPIDSLHSKVCLYRAPVHGFEYPYTPASTDYTTLINSIAFYAGHDVTLLHPQLLAKQCTVTDGRLHLSASQSFRILVVPSERLIRLDALNRIMEFYRSGGKLILTGEFPDRAFEWTPDQDQNSKVREMIRELFGEDALDPTIIRNLRYAQNDRGGEAYWLYQTESATDGTMMVDCVTLASILSGFSVPLDIYIPEMPRFICTGALNNAYPEFVALGLHRAVPGDGMLGHLHKRRGKNDIFYFGNSTNLAFCGEVLLRGEHRLLCCNPHTGQITPVSSDTTRKNGENYTRFVLSLPADQVRVLLSIRE